MLKDSKIPKKILAIETKISEGKRVCVLNRLL